MKLKLIALAVLGSSFAVGHAAIAYNNFGAGDTFNAGGNWSVYMDQGLILPFTSAATGQLSSITVALFNNANYTATLETVNAGLPGTVLQTWNFAGTNGAQTLSAVGVTNLVNGTSYQVHIEPATSNDSGAWYYNGIGATGTFYFSDATNTWHTGNGALNALRVETVPEPATMAIIGLGLAALKLRRRRS